MTDNVEGSQSVINSMVALKQLHFTLCILLAFAPHITSVQYCGGCSVHWKLFSTSEVVQYIGGCSVHRGDNISTVGDNISTVGDSFSTVGG